MSSNCTTVHAEATATAIREDDRRRPALEILDDHAPLVFPQPEPPVPGLPDP